MPRLIVRTDLGWFIRRNNYGKWSLAYDKSGERYVPLSETYGTTRTWWLWRFSLRRHGRLRP